MIRKEDVAPAQWEAFGPFAVCETLAELVVAVNKVHGMEGVENLLAEPGFKDTVREGANQLRHAGLVELATVVRKAVRKAKPMPPTFLERMKARREGRGSAAIRPLATVRN